MSNDIIDVSMISNKTNKQKAAITAVGGFVPDDFLSNRDLEKLVDNKKRKPPPGTMVALRGEGTKK